MQWSGKGPSVKDMQASITSWIWTWLPANAPQMVLGEKITSPLPLFYCIRHPAFIAV